MRGLRRRKEPKPSKENVQWKDNMNMKLNTKCSTCGAEMMVSVTGMSCPNGHGKIIPLTTMQRKELGGRIDMIHDDEKIECLECKGTGEIECPECEGTGWTECPHCFSEVECPECDGDGMLECDVCGGTGLLGGKKKP